MRSSSITSSGSEFLREIRDNCWVFVVCGRYGLRVYKTELREILKDCPVDQIRYYTETPNNPTRWRRKEVWIEEWT